MKSRTAHNNTDTLYSQNSFLLKFAPNGDLIWSKSTGGITNIYSKAIAIDTENNLLITGESIDISLYDTLEPVNSLDSIYNPFTQSYSYFHTFSGFIAKYDKYGNQIWIIATGGEPESIRTDHNNNVIITGQYGQDDGDFGGQAFEPIGSKTGFIAQYDPDGLFNWVQTFGGSSNWNNGYSIEVDTDNNIFLTGHLSGSDIHFDGNIISTQPLTDGFLAKFQSNGNLNWVHQLGQGEALCYDIQLSQNNELWLIGSILDGTQFLGTSDWINPTSGDLMILRYDTDGQIQDIGIYQGQSLAEGNHITEGINGEWYITGGAFYSGTGNEHNAFIARIDGLSGIWTGTDNLIENDLILFPNPNNGTFYLEHPASFPLIEQINIYSIDGKLNQRYQRPIHGNPIQIVSREVCFVEIIAGDVVKRKRIVVY